MLYIRHSFKAYQNGKCDSTQKKFDPPLTDEGQKLAQLKFKALLSERSVPEMIVSSPLLRARQTACIAQDVIFTETGISVPIVINRALGEYFGNHKGIIADDDFHPETLLFDPIRSENMRGLSLRVKNFREELTGGSEKIIWHVTHGIVITELAKQYGQPIRYPKELQGIEIKDGVVSSL
jgi:broad specificity phosphatase PhoE